MLLDLMGFEGFELEGAQFLNQFLDSEGRINSVGEFMELDSGAEKED